jgi:transposase
MKAKAAGLGWPEVASITKAQLNERLFPIQRPPTPINRPEPDYKYIYDELRRYRKVNLTLSQLWLEYKGKHSNGYQYSHFCELYRHGRGKLDYCMRQEPRGGEKVFLDYSDGLSIVNRFSGELTLTQLFLAVWGASNYTCGEDSARLKKVRWRKTTRIHL